MRILWTLFKVILGLAIALPLGILAVALTFGVVGTLLALAVLTIKLLCVGFIAYGAFRLARFFFAPPRKPSMTPIRELPVRDPYYEAAVRELDAELR
jgi:hypothetical protein